MMTNKCKAISNYIIDEVNEYNLGKRYDKKVYLCNKRLQKILFLIDVKHMLLNYGLPMFEDEFYIWPSGPVIPTLYKEFFEYQDGEKRTIILEENIYLDEKIKCIINEVLTLTKDLDTIDLINLCNSDLFSQDNLNEVLSKKETYNYYLYENLEIKKDKVKKLSIKR